MCWSVRKWTGFTGGGSGDENWVVGGGTMRLQVVQLVVRKESVGKFRWFWDAGWLKFGL